MLKAWLLRALVKVLLLADGWTPQLLSNQDAAVILGNCDHGAGWGLFANIPDDPHVP